MHPTQLGTRSHAPIRVSKCQPELETAPASFSAGGTKQAAQQEKLGNSIGCLGLPSAPPLLGSPVLVVAPLGIGSGDRLTLACRPVLWGLCPPIPRAPGPPPCSSDEYPLSLPLPWMYSISRSPAQGDIAGVPSRPCRLAPTGGPTGGSNMPTCSSPGTTFQFQSHALHSLCKVLLPPPSSPTPKQVSLGPPEILRPTPE